MYKKEINGFASSLINNEEQNQISLIMDSFFGKINQLVSEHKYEILELPTFLLCIAEAFDLFVEKERWMENIKTITKDIMHNFSCFHPTAYFGGIGDVSYAIKCLYDKLGCCQGLTNQLNDILKMNIKINFRHEVYKIENVKARDYDLITGLSGTAYYLLQIEPNNSELLNRIVIYLSDLIDYVEEEKFTLPQFIIKNENQCSALDKMKFKNGNINLGVSHGILSAILVLSIVYRYFSPSTELLNKINKVISIYQDFRKEIDGVIYWPGQLPTDDYILKRTNVVVKRNSWCYGTIGITRQLYMIARNIKNSNLEKIAVENVHNIAKLDIAKYNLDSAIICHGYAGALYILSLFYNEGFKDKYVKKKIQELSSKVIEEYDINSKYGFPHKDWVLFDNKEKIAEIDNGSLLEGASGIILALFALSKKDTMLKNHLLM